MILLYKDKHMEWTWLFVKSYIDEDFYNGGQNKKLKISPKF